MLTQELRIVRNVPEAAGTFQARRFLITRRSRVREASLAEPAAGLQARVGRAICWMEISLSSTTSMSRFVFPALSLLGIVLSSTAFAATRDEQTAACKGDAIRYCASHIPNKQKITACMKEHFQQLSPGCKAMFKQPATTKH
jgi:hypothetical protein